MYVILIISIEMNQSTYFLSLFRYKVAKSKRDIDINIDFSPKHHLMYLMYLIIK